MIPCSTIRLYIDRLTHITDGFYIAQKCCIFVQPVAFNERFVAFISLLTLLPSQGLFYIPAFFTYCLKIYLYIATALYLVHLCMYLLT